jgi:hypothetical protein
LFVIFLSPVSITKPWVNRELRRAIMREIEGVDPDFIIPVLIGEIDAVPAFLEGKKYVALHRMPEEEWLPELVAAIQGTQAPTADEITQNVGYHIAAAPNEPHVARITFLAKLWPAPMAFSVETSEDIVWCNDEWPGAVVMSYREESRGDRHFAVRVGEPLIRPGYSVVFVLEFAPGTDAVAAIEHVAHWNAP